MNTACISALAFAALFVGALQTAAASESSDNVALKRGDYWEMWLKASHRQCPGNHIEWLGMSEDAAGLVGGFLGTLSPSDQERVANLVDRLNLCHQEKFGFTCYLTVHVDAFSRLGLLSRFAKFGCEHYDCDKDGFCNSVRAK